MSQGKAITGECSVLASGLGAVGGRISRTFVLVYEEKSGSYIHICQFSGAEDVHFRRHLSRRNMGNPGVIILLRATLVAGKQTNDHAIAFPKKNRQF